MNARQANTISRSMRPGFTMIEILLASMILAIGFMMLLPAFTVGLAESRDAIDGTTAAEVAQNAAAYCATLLTKSDPNWATANATDGALHAYQFNLGAPGMTDALANDAATEKQYSIRVHGDPDRSRFYWNLLYRIDTTRQSNQVELWVMVCKRNEVGGLNALMSPKSIDVSGSAGSKSINASENLVPGTSLITNTGEVLNVMINNNGAITLDREITSSFTSAWIVRAGSGDNHNACIYAAHTKKSF